MEKTELYYQVAHTHLVEQDHRNSQLESKATSILVIAATLVGVAAIVLKDFSASASDLSRTDLGFAAAVLLSFFVTVGFAIAALRVRTFDRRPVLGTFATHLSGDYESTKLVEWVGDEFAHSVEHNHGELAIKAKWVAWIIRAFVVQTALTGLLAVALRL